jgi:hypothetical protein
MPSHGYQKSGDSGSKKAVSEVDSSKTHKAGRATAP